MHGVAIDIDGGNKWGSRLIGSTSDEQYPLSLKQQQQEINIPVTTRLTPNLPGRFLLAGPRKNYLKVGLPLYEASIKCDWKAAKAILDKNPELVRYSITENGETALHIAASAKRSKKMEEFVEHLVDMMDKEDLLLENEHFNTAFYVAAASGNVEPMKIMVKKNRSLLVVPGGRGKMMPLYVAALVGHHEVVKYLYENSNDLCDDGWDRQNRGWLLHKCVENDMFDVALQIAKKYPELGSGNELALLARKPSAFFATKYNINDINISVFALFRSKVKVGATKKESEALQLLRFIWEDIAKKPKYEIDRILRGPSDSNQEDKSASGPVVQLMQLQKLIFENTDRMEAEAQNIMTQQPDSTEEDPNSASRKTDRVQKLRKLVSEFLVNMHVEAQNIITGVPDSIKQDNKTVSSKADQALELQKLVSQHIVSMHDEMQKIIETTRKEVLSQQLERFIYKQTDKMRKDTERIIRRPARFSYSSRILFVAAELGNTNFLVELIRGYPDLIWKVNDNNQSIFHIAVKNRHEGIYNLLYEIGAMKDLVTPLRDVDENNMLHLAGKSTQKKRLEDVSGAALQIQRELLWFEEVESMIPPSYRERKNKDGLTPHELFTMDHTNLITEGEKWMKETASQCMVVAALIATTVFAAAFTVPGGYNQNDGIPMFYRKITFVVFVVADAISLFLSSASILTFLSILTSRYAERDFLESLPKKLMLGLAALFLSITTMVVTFSISFFILYHQEMKWIPILICVCAISPVLLYVVLQYPLLIDVIRSTYGSKYLFKPTNQVLFYENPKF